jgi:hypothetical protein
MLPGAVVCPICEADAAGGRGDTVAENLAGGRGSTQAEPGMLRPPSPAPFPPPPAPGGGYGGASVPNFGSRGGTVLTGGQPPAGMTGPTRGGAPAPGSRSGTMVVPQPDKAGQVPQTAERRIVAVLVTFDATPSGLIFPVRVGRNRIGRDPGNEIQIPSDAAMSGTNTFIHFYEGSGSFVINDANSQNGTYVNGKNLEGDSVKASNYTTIRAGITQFTLMMVNPPGTPSESGGKE